MRLIDADALQAEYKQYHGGKRLLLIDTAPTIEPRPRGRWIPCDIPWYQCSECGAIRENKAFMEYFCPNCGADMR